MTRISSEQENKILELLYTSDFSDTKIAKVVGCKSTSPVARIRKENGITNKKYLQEYEVVGDYSLIHIKHYGEDCVVKIDTEDIQKCKEYGKWSISNNGYVINANSGKLLSRLVMDCPKGMFVDHIHHNLLDNRKSQLRIVTPTQNSFNRGKNSNNKSGHKCVSFDKERNAWCVFIKNGEERIARRFHKYEEACQYADEMMRVIQGDLMYKE